VLTKLVPLLTVFLGLSLSACTSATPTGKIAFSSNRDGNAEIYVMNADGTDLMRMTHDPAPDTNPVWSPDGTRFAYNRDNNEIFVMQPAAP